MIQNALQVRGIQRPEEMPLPRAKVVTSAVR